MKGSLSAYVFWACLGAVLYTYVGYPVLLFLLAALTQTVRDLEFALARRERRTADREHLAPRVAMLVAAHNEQDVIEAKLRNTAALDYPQEQFEFLLGLDAPSDSTPARAQSVKHPAFRVFHFADPSIGAVCGELRMVSPNGKFEMESLYWRYEVVLKFLENRLNCVLGANGGVFAVRRNLYLPPVSAIVEDFQVPMDIRYAGHRLVYDPEAVATEEVAPTYADEFRRKVRIGTGAFQTLFRSPKFLNPLKGLPAFAYFSHKVLRWIGPLLLIAVLITNVLLAMAAPIYAILLAAQAAFYLLSGVGWLRVRSGRPGGLAGAAFYFTSMNLALLLGLLRLLGGRQQTVWAATPRRVPAHVAHVKGDLHE